MPRKAFTCQAISISMRQDELFDQADSVVWCCSRVLWKAQLLLLFQFTEPRAQLQWVVGLLNPTRHPGSPIRREAGQTGMLQGREPIFLDVLKRLWADMGSGFWGLIYT